MAFNILSKKVLTSAALHLKDPDGNFMYADEAETQPVTIEFYGRSSPQYRKWLAASLKTNEKRGKKPRSLDELNAESVEMYVALTKAMNNLAYGDSVASTPEQYRAVYSDVGLHWVNDQASEYLAETANFSAQ